jgi:hypothetical protein
MWLLTDVPSTGQRMSYIPGSHKLRHPWDATPEQTRFTREQALAYGEILECAAPAGSVIIFDTNGIHKGNRNLGPTRDIVLSAYSTGRYRNGFRFDIGNLHHLSEWQRRIVKRSRKASRGYGLPLPDEYEKQLG